MASKKYIELTGYSDEDLQRELKDTEIQAARMKFDHAVKGLDNPMRLKMVRRDIARLKTEVKRRDLQS